MSIEAQTIDFKLFKDPRIRNWFKLVSKPSLQILLNLLNNTVKFTHEVKAASNKIWAVSSKQFDPQLAEIFIQMTEVINR